MKTPFLISSIDYDASVAFTNRAVCPVVSHGLHLILHGKTCCEHCGAESVEKIASKGEPCSQITGWQHKPLEKNGWLVKGAHGPLLIEANTASDALALYLQS